MISNLIHFLGGNEAPTRNQLHPVVKVDAFSKINASSLGRLIREVDAMLRPGGVLYVRFSIHCHILQLIYMNV